jgi:glycosyltransferase involved in cell wall biosynthesis
MQPMLEYYFHRYSFTSAANYLNLPTELPSLPVGQASRLPEASGALRASETLALREEGPARTPVTVVVPCYNEELILPYLANTLKSVIASLEKDYELSFVFVNDGSKDGTAGALEKIFGGRPRTTIHHHETNRGVAAAILTGIRRASTELVCSIDCDCTYDPHELAKMIPLLTEGVDVVTASPYHPEGAVRNVPGWRLFLSRSSSFLYRRVLRQKLYTYTSCFRLYRRSAVVDLDIRETGFLGVAEILGKLDLRGARIVEYPAVLEVRMLGRSKMKTVRTILGHLRLMSRLLWLRLRGKGSPPVVPVVTADAEHSQQGAHA